MQLRSGAFKEVVVWGEKCRCAEVAELKLTGASPLGLHRKKRSYPPLGRYWSSIWSAVGFKSNWSRGKCARMKIQVVSKSKKQKAKRVWGWRYKLQKQNTTSLSIQWDLIFLHSEKSPLLTAHIHAWRLTKIQNPCLTLDSCQKWSQKWDCRTTSGPEVKYCSILTR